MNLYFMLLMLATILVGVLGFAVFSGTIADWTQVAFFALIVAAFVTLVYDKRRPI